MAGLSYDNLNKFSYLIKSPEIYQITVVPPISPFFSFRGHDLNRLYGDTSGS